MKIMSAIIKLSNRPEAKEAGILDQCLRRKHVAVLFEPAAQAAPVVASIFDFPSAWGSRTTPANAAGFFRTALSAETIVSGFSKPTRSLTDHMTIK